MVAAATAVVIIVMMIMTMTVVQSMLHLFLDARANLGSMSLFVDLLDQVISTLVECFGLFVKGHPGKFGQLRTRLFQ